MEEFSRNSVPSNELQIYTWYILQYIDVAIVLAKSKVGPLQLDLLFHTGPTDLEICTLQNDCNHTHAKFYYSE